MQIVEGPDPLTMKPLAEEALPTLIALMKDESVVVRDTTAWALGRICEVVSEAALAPNHLGPLLEALVEALQAEPRVAANACWALSSLAEAAYENATEGRTDDSKEPETYCLSGFFRPIVDKLLATTDRQDGGQVLHNLKVVNRWCFIRCFSPIIILFLSRQICVLLLMKPSWK